MDKVKIWRRRFWLLFIVFSTFIVLVVSFFISAKLFFIHHYHEVDLFYEEIELLDKLISHSNLKVKDLEKIYGELDFSEAQIIPIDKSLEETTETYILLGRMNIYYNEDSIITRVSWWYP